MISALVDGVLLLALVITTWKMVAMYRELKRLGSYHMDYQRIFDQTALALDGIEVSIQELNVRGAQVLNALGSRMDDARELIAEIDSLTREAKRQQSILRAELKELSKATAMMAKRKPDDGADFNEKTKAEKHLPHPLLASAPRPETAGVAAPRATRIHRIDDTFGSPFRSVSMSQKDDL
ncbi:hypothetical protein [uncultured Roseibium sp.]|uniref:hypothetical protein n=1 Tax=uncultured Roseibium sp. TaxID=1936171 RepID=UPI0032166FC0